MRFDMGDKCKGHFDNYISECPMYATQGVVMMNQIDSCISNVCNMVMLRFEIMYPIYSICVLQLCDAAAHTCGIQILHQRESVTIKQ